MINDEPSEEVDCFKSWGRKWQPILELPWYGMSYDFGAYVRNFGAYVPNFGALMGV